MTIDDERRGLTEPLESVTRFFGVLMLIAALVGVAFLVFSSSGTYGGLPGAVCVTQPATEYSGDWNICQPCVANGTRPVDATYST